MAYDKHTWTCDEPITVERLNHIEDGIANASGGDCGFECTETVTTLTEESVTTTAQGGYNTGTLSYSQLIDVDSVTVTFDGVEYECPLIDLAGSNGYGGWNTNTGYPDFSQYPFALISEFDGDNVGNTLITATAGTHAIKIETVEEIVTTTPCFDKARGYSCEETVTLLTEETVTTEADGNVGVGELSYSQFINAETIRVTFDGVEYECPRIVVGNESAYGAPNGPVFTEYPFAIISGNLNEIYTETAGTHTIKIEAVETTVTTTPCFDKAMGYWCEEGIVTLTEETVTTRMEEGDNAAFGDLSYSQLIDADSIKVTFDGVEYECPRMDDGNYGAPYDPSTNTFDWSEYPFEVFDNILATETAGTYTIKIEAMGTTVTTTPCFENAVKAVIPSSVEVPKKGL